MKEFKIIKDFSENLVFYRVFIKKRFLFWVYWKDLNVRMVDLESAARYLNKFMGKNHPKERSIIYLYRGCI